MKRYFFILSFCWISFSLFSQTPKPEYAVYIDLYKDCAIREMKLYGIPASITLAQGILESSNGRSPLATKANNHFGIKCHMDWEGDTVLYDDDAKGECFRKYLSAEESFHDHSLFIISRKRYVALFSLDMKDYTGWAFGLKQAGYATNPTYPQQLIRLIEDNQLYMFDDTLKQPIILPVDTALAGKPSESVPPKLEESATAAPPESAEDGAISVVTLASRQFKKGYTFPNPDHFKVLRTSPSGRNVYENNGIPFVFARKDDTWFLLGKEFRVPARQLASDNEMKESDPITPGQLVYLESKKRTSPRGFHEVGRFDSMYAISQLYGVKLKFIYKYNGITANDELHRGDRIYLDDKKHEKK